MKQILDDREIRKVDDLVRRCGVTGRAAALQRLFHDYVGVPPKLGDSAAIADARGDRAGRRWSVVDWSALALELGYA